eukprot:CAMPEP_0115873014 /NCGR_PEP_ID=MMETSP0287-20121206/23753_1 /TAXON_ID=412157 /ORGANISM="Chrysochromulina rotalis, Strain UIO044" /LENGTH=276 /DNA_ID=CAMNT_0003328013 /DNA_START=208 /DNA_END=1036 /DNA_ORIENTATION=-
MAEAWIAMIELAASTIEATFATLRVCTQAPGRSLSTRGVLVDVRIWIHTAPASATRRPLSKPSLHCHSACARRRSDHPARACAYSRFVVPPLIESRSLVNNTACASERPCVLGGSSLEAEGFLVGGESGAKLARLAVAAALVETSTGEKHGAAVDASITSSTLAIAPSRSPSVSSAPTRAAPALRLAASSAASESALSRCWRAAAAAAAASTAPPGAARSESSIAIARFVNDGASGPLPMPRSWRARSTSTVLEAQRRASCVSECGGSERVRSTAI